MPLTPERRRRIEGIQAAMLQYVERAADAVDDVQRAQARGLNAVVDRDVCYALLAASTGALDRDDAERERRTTLRVAQVATAAAVASVFVAAAQVWVQVRHESRPLVQTVVHDAAQATAPAAPKLP